MAEEKSIDRLISLDVFRGLTIAGMVLVNNPGTWSAIYGPLKHAEWHGITPTDYVFPFFLFIVGVAIPMALGKRLTEGVSRSVYWKIVQRSVKIFVLGLLMSMIPFFTFGDTVLPQIVKLGLMLAFTAALFFYLADKKIIAAAIAGVTAVVILILYSAGTEFVWYNFAAMRIPGVLQRIAVCYLVVSLIFIHTSWKQQAAIAIGLLLSYWALMTLIPVPGCEVTTINDKACNIAAWLDRTILTEAHIWRAGIVFDPEGILSTLPAIATTISGVLTGTWLMRAEKSDSDSTDEAPLRSYPTKIDKAVGLFFMGTVLLAIGWSWSLVFPLNKSLWTSSYVVYTSGLALLTLAFCYFVIDIKGYKKWAKPFVIFGVNALALFVFSGIMARMLGLVKVAGTEGKDISLQQWIYQNLFLSWAEPLNASLAYAVVFIVFWLFLMSLLYRRRMLIKV